MSLPIGRHLDLDSYLLLPLQWSHALRNLWLVLYNSLNLLYNPLVDLINDIQREQLLLQLLGARAPKNDGTGVRHLRDVRERELDDTRVEL